MSRIDEQDHAGQVIQIDRPKIEHHTQATEADRATRSDQENKANQGNKADRETKADRVSKRDESSPSVSFVTLGCKVNQTESEAMAQLFRNAGYRVVPPSESADVVVVNTCTVTNTGDRKSRQTIRRMINAHPDSFVVVAGCYAQTAPGEVLNLKGVDLVLGTQDRSRILELIEQAKKEQKPYNAVRGIWKAQTFEELSLLEGESRTRATLKIQEGCNQFCTYCIIPYARGPVRSRLPENALAEARKLVAKGYKEIVLTGIHTGAYGQDLGEEWNLARLVRELVQIEGLARLRLSSIEPMEFTPELIEVITSNPVVCPHLHIPLQSGSGEILTRMKRPYTLDEYYNLLQTIRQKLPLIAITTDVIVGFPGETEENHRESLAFVEKCGFAGIHVFPYSQRKGTPAASYPGQLSNKVKHERAQQMGKVASESQKRYVRRFIGQKVNVLIERIGEDGQATGHTENYIQVTLPPRPEEPWQQGDIVECVLEEGYLSLSEE